jgi:alpha/beta superfamily hydrolase
MCGMNAVSTPLITEAAPPARAIRSLHLKGPAGRLEAVLNEGSPDARFAALVCHPHPRYGGALHNKVVYHAMKVMNDPAWGFGWPVLRFNFRGTGLSEGQHDGKAEVGDVKAALDWLETELQLPIVAAGFSFGAAMALKCCCDPRQSGKNVHTENNIQAVIALGLPTSADGRNYHYSFLGNDPHPKFFLSGDRDEFAPAEQLVEIASTAAGPKRLVLIPGADHFFTGQLQPMQQALGSWLKEQIP